MKRLLIAVLLVVFSHVLSLASPPCFEWSKYTDVADSFRIYQAPVVNDAIVPGSETISVDKIATTATSVCTLKENTEDTVYWIVAISNEGSESAPSTAVRIGVKKYPAVPVEVTAPSSFK